MSNSDPRFGDLIAWRDDFLQEFTHYPYIVLGRLFKHDGECGPIYLNLLLPDGRIGYEMLETIREKYIILSRVDA